MSSWWTLSNVIMFRSFQLLDHRWTIGYTLYFIVARVYTFYIGLYYIRERWNDMVVTLASGLRNITSTCRSIVTAADKHLWTFSQCQLITETPLHTSTNPHQRHRRRRSAVSPRQQHAMYGCSARGSCGVYVGLLTCGTVSQLWPGIDGKFIDGCLLL
jgi:hypothetical protein